MLDFFKRVYKRFIKARELEAAEHIRKWREDGTLPPVK